MKEKLTSFANKSFIVGVIGIALSVLGFLTQREAFAPSYLISYLFWMGVTVGCFPLLMLHSLTGGNWGYPIRRLAEVTLKLLPWLAVAFIPIALCMYELYHWTHADAVAHDPILQHKAGYLNTPFFLVRLVIYFVIWFVMANRMIAWSKAYDETGDDGFNSKLQALSGGGLILYGMTVTFSSIDWAMSLEPHWFSTIYGMIFMVGDGLAALAFTIFGVVLLSKFKPLKQSFSTDRSHDLGSLLFAFVMVWAYVSISQFIIIWSGNLAEEAPWYLIRFRGDWYILALALVGLHFFVPFFLLLMRKTKRNFQTLATVAGFVLLMRYFDLFWYVKPNFYENLSFHWLDAATVLAIGGIWVGLLCRMIANEKLTFRRDPIKQKEEQES